MKYRSRKAKPPAGMEMTVTLSMSADQSTEEAAAAIVKFFEIVHGATAELKASWVRIHCADIPAELEDRLQGAFDSANKKPALSVVVDNTKTVST